MPLTLLSTHHPLFPVTLTALYRHQLLQTQLGWLALVERQARNQPTATTLLNILWGHTSLPLKSLQPSLSQEVLIIQRA